jgi:hypothetical protein
MVAITITLLIPLLAGSFCRQQEHNEYNLIPSGCRIGNRKIG